MIQYTHILWASTDPSLSARISISYYSLTQTNSPRILSELRVHVGDLDVSIALPREATLKTTLARILIALVLFPYISKKFVLLGLSQDFQISSDTLFSSLRLRKLKRVTSMKSLMERACRTMALIQLYSHGARLSIPAFTDPLYVDIAIFMNLQRYYDMLETLNKDPRSRRRPCSSLQE